MKRTESARNRNARCRHKALPLPSEAQAGARQGATLAAGQTDLCPSRGPVSSFINVKLFKSVTREYYEMPVATYGVAPDREGDGSEARDEEHRGENSALLGEDAVPTGLSKPDGHAALPGSIGNLANTIIGSGTFRALITLGRMTHRK